MNESATFSVFGIGKLGASMAAAIASRGFHVICVDIDSRVVDLLNKGGTPVQEPHLEETISANRERLRATLSSREAVLDSEASFVIVPTPADERGSFSLQYASEAFREIGRALSEKSTYHLVVLTSTVLPGSTRYGLLPILERESGKKCGKDFGICFSPEFIALGSVIRDFLNPDFTLVGELDNRSGSLLESYYSRIMCNNPPCKRMSIENAELAKIALNAFVTTKITYANMLAELCEQIPWGDVDVVTDAIGTDRRIGHKYLTGALGYGGPCFPRDNLAFRFIAEELGASATIPEVTHLSNRSFVERIINRLTPEIQNCKTLAILGLAYKPDSNVVEESQALFLARELAKKGCHVMAYDPLAGNNARSELDDDVLVVDSMELCLEEADIVLITTPDSKFKSITPGHFKGRKVTVVDYWRILDHKFVGIENIRYIPFGRSIDNNLNIKRLAKLWQCFDD